MMKNLFLTVIATACLPGCMSTPVAPEIATDELLSGKILFGSTVDTTDIDAGDVLAVSDEMRSYVDDKVRDYPQARARLNRLVGGMIDDGLLTMSYDADRTHTAVETFVHREGNCLSFSILFAALAREANLRATFQMVDIPPSFRSDGEVIMLDNHINVRIDGLRKDILHTSDYVVDFNNAEYKGNYRTRKVDDNYAIALYYSNIAVERLRAEDWWAAFRFLKKAIETDASIPGLWVNLGVLYSRNEFPEVAIQSYRQALSIRPSNRSALVNLASTLNQLGRADEAEYVSGRVAYYRKRHPYYHYYLAQVAYEDDRFEDSAGHLAKAIKLKEDEHQFYYLRGLMHEKRARPDLALQDYTKARDLVRDQKLIAAYERKLDELEGVAN